jgi:hypothetical protein
LRWPSRLKDQLQQLLIADGVYNMLKSTNIRECVRIARLAKNDSVQVNRIIDTFAKYGSF